MQELQDLEFGSIIFKFEPKSLENLYKKNIRLIFGIKTEILIQFCVSIVRLEVYRRNVDSKKWYVMIVTKETAKDGNCNRSL